MLVLVSYDICTLEPEDRRRLRHVAKACQNFGVRVQNSVFECNVDQAQWTTLRARLLKILEPKCDSLRFYFLGNNYKNRVEHHGSKPSIDVEDPLIF